MPKSPSPTAPESTVEASVPENGLKFCILNGSGNVGKTTIAAQLLYPRLTQLHGGVPPRLQELENLNYSASKLPGIVAEPLTGAQYRAVYEASFESEPLVVDVGASNIAIFLSKMGAYQGSHEIFDCFLLPVTPGDKEIRDTLATLKALHKFGVGAERIRVVFNRVRADEGLNDFKVLVDASELPAYAFMYDPSLVLYEVELFKDLGEMGETVESILSDTVDDDKLIPVTKGAEKRRHVQRSMAKRLAGSVQGNMDAVFKSLMNGL